MARRPLSKLICAKGERNCKPSADQGLCTAKPTSSHAVCLLPFGCTHPSPHFLPFL